MMLLLTDWSTKVADNRHRRGGQGAQPVAEGDRRPLRLCARRALKRHEQGIIMIIMKQSNYSPNGNGKDFASQTWFCVLRFEDSCRAATGTTCSTSSRSASSFSSSSGSSSEVNFIKTRARLNYPQATNFSFLCSRPMTWQT